MTLPGYWMYETSGVLRPVVEDYLHHRPLTEEQVALMRAYLSQWIMLGAWEGARQLRADVATIRTTEDVTRWLYAAERVGIDPL